MSARKRHCVLMSAAVLAAMGLVPSPAHAAPIINYATDFNSAAAGHTGNFAGSADYSDGPIIGQDGWALVNSTNSAVVVQNTATNGNVPLGTSGQDVGRAFTPTIAVSNGGSVFLSADITLTSAQGGDYFIHISDGGTSQFFDRTYAKASGGGFVMALGTSSGTNVTYGSTVLNFNQTYHMVAEYDFVAGGTNNDTCELYINPTDPVVGGDNLYVAGTTTGVDAATVIGGVNLRQGSATLAPAETVDNIMLAYVAPTPEPGSLALVAGAAMGLAGMRNRKPKLRGLADEIK